MLGDGTGLGYIEGHGDIVEAVADIDSNIDSSITGYFPRTADNIPHSFYDTPGRNSVNVYKCGHPVYLAGGWRDRIGENLPLGVNL